MGKGTCVGVITLVSSSSTSKRNHVGVIPTVHPGAEEYSHVAGVQSRATHMLVKIQSQREIPIRYHAEVNLVTLQSRGWRSTGKVIHAEW